MHLAGSDVDCDQAAGHGLPKHSKSELDAEQPLSRSRLNHVIRTIEAPRGPVDPTRARRQLIES